MFFSFKKIFLLKFKKFVKNYITMIVKIYNEFCYIYFLKLFLTYLFFIIYTKLFNILIMKSDSIYFYISYTRKQRENSEDIEFIEPAKKNEKPECINTKVDMENNYYYYSKIYKVNKLAGKGEKGNNYYFEYEIGDEKYIISFDSKGCTFIYDINLEYGKKIINIRRKINQNKEYNEKNDMFLEALTKNGSENLIDELYNETIELYSKKKGFSFLIGLFLKIYKKKNLCTKLLKVFKKMNENPKSNEKNMDRKGFLKDKSLFFKAIIDEADTLIDNYNYEITEFYGIILCYLNSYDHNTFPLIIKKLYNKNPDDLYKILLIYKAHFKFPINQNFDFFNNFISYNVKNKDFTLFKKGLDYIRDIETFIKVIEKNKEDIFNKYNSQIIDNCIKLDNLKFKKNDVIEIESKITQEKKISIEKEDIIDKKDIKQIAKKIDSDTRNKKENISILEVIKDIKSIINYSNENKTFLIYFTNNFWQYILNSFKEPKQDNILICYKIREIFIKYHKLVMNVFGKIEKGKSKSPIKKEAFSYFEKDEFAFLLDQIIRKYINNNKELDNIEKLAFITEYNPYYKDNKYSNKIDCDIFDLFDLNKIDDDFIGDFREMNFENIFKDKIPEYIKKIIDKIQIIQDFEPIIGLINIQKLENKNIFLELLNKKYDSISSKIGSSNEKEAINVVVKIALINYIYEKNGKKLDFIKKRIKKLDHSIIPLIFIEMINHCFNKENGDHKAEEEEDEEKEEKEKGGIKLRIFEEEVIDFNELKEFIFEEFANNLKDSSDIENIIKLIECLESKNKNEENEDIQMIVQNEKDKEKENILNEFLKKLFSKNLFSKEEFFSSNKNLKISLLYELKQKGKIKKNSEEYYDKIIEILDNIHKDIDGEIRKSKLEEFLKNDEIKERLSLIKLSFEGFNPDEQYEELKKKNDEINRNIDKLKYIKENIIIYHKETYQDRIAEMIEVIKSNKNKKIMEYKGGKIRELIKETEGLNELADRIQKVKNFLLFNVIYDKNQRTKEDDHFENAYKTLDDIEELLNKKTDIVELNKYYQGIISEVKKKLSNNEERAQKFIQNLIEYFKINDKNLIDELTILFKSKKYELDINSIKFFFEYFKKDNQKWNEKLPPADFQEKWKEDFKNIKKDLNLLKQNGIYDYTNIGYYNKLFTCLYDKKEAIDFLFSKTSEDIKRLKDKIQPTDRTINIQEIIGLDKCVSAITKMKKLEDNFRIFEYIKSMKKEEISDFENYSKIYPSIIQLDSNDDF